MIKFFTASLEPYALWHDFKTPRPYKDRSDHRKYAKSAKKI